MTKPSETYENRHDVEEGCIIFVDNRTKQNSTKQGSLWQEVDTSIAASNERISLRQPEKRM